MENTLNKFIFFMFAIMACIWIGVAVTSCGSGGSGGGGGNGGGTGIGNITIIEDTLPNDAQDFVFTGTGSGVSASFSLDDDADGTLQNSVTFNNLSVATYTVTEGTVYGMALTGLSCSGGSSTSVDIAQAKATINLKADEDVICTFTNKPQSKYLYVANTDEDTISAFSLNGNTGVLTFIGNTPLIANSAPTGLALAADGMYLYSANSNAKGSIGKLGASTISAYLINATGGLEEISGSPFSVSGTATLVNLAMHTSGEYLYGTNHHSGTSGSVTAFLVNSVSGELTEDTPLALSYAHGIAMHPSGEYFFVSTSNGANDADGEVHSFDVDPLDGSFSAVSNSPFADEGANVWITITPDGKYLYSADASLTTSVGGQIRGFAVNSVSGDLDELSGSPFKPAGITNDVRAVLAEPNGKYLYGAYSAVFEDNDSIGAFTIGVDGSLANVPGMPFVAGEQPKALSSDKLGRFLYVVNYPDGTVSAFSINPSTGALTLIDTYTVGAGPKAILTAP